MDIIDAIIPIAVSCVMPVLIVWLLARVSIKKSEHKTNALIKAIENGSEIDPNVLMAAKTKSKSTRMELVGKLEAAVVFITMGLFFVLSAAFGLSSFPAWGYYPGFPLLAVGIGCLVSFFFGIKYLKADIDKEDSR